MGLARKEEPAQGRFRRNRSGSLADFPREFTWRARARGFARLIGPSVRIIVVPAGLTRAGGACERAGPPPKPPSRLPDRPVPAGVAPMKIRKGSILALTMVATGLAGFALALDDEGTKTHKAMEKVQ